MDSTKVLVLYAANIEAREFKREAKKFQEHHKLPDSAMIPVDCSKRQWRRRNTVLNALGACEDLEVVAMFCHGWPRRIQFGFNLENLNALADVLRQSTANDANIVLYACSCGRRPGLNPKRQVYYPDMYVGRGSFADQLNQESGGDRTTWAHYNSGHTTRNPYVMIFTAWRSVEWRVGPHTVRWRVWAKEMQGKLRFNFFLGGE